MTDKPRFISLLPGLSERSWNRLTLAAAPFWICGGVIVYVNRSGAAGWQLSWIAVAAALGAFILMAIFAGVARVRGKRESAAGYTTVMGDRGVPRVDPKTGLVLHDASERS